MSTTEKDIADAEACADKRREERRIRDRRRKSKKRLLAVLHAIEHARKQAGLNK